MIVRILSSSATFNGVSYNTNKIDEGRGELMQAANFGALHGLDEWKPQDYKNYFKMVSALNKRVKSPQFHAAISAKGKAYSKEELTQIGRLWLEQMGYAKQPFLIVFHKDTDNNHVHIVSTRIDRQGKKINSGFENIRAVACLNRVMGIDEHHSAQADIQRALSYNYSTRAQFMVVLEAMGYLLKEKDGKLEVIKFGKKQGDIDVALITKAIEGRSVNEERKKQLKAVFNKYAVLYDTSLQSVNVPQSFANEPNSYSSEFAACLKEKFGVVLVFHAAKGQAPCGYSIIDHAGKAVFKGGEIMPLKNLLSKQVGEKGLTVKVPRAFKSVSIVDERTRNYYQSLLQAAIANYPDLLQGLRHQGLVIVRTTNSLLLYDPVAEVYLDCRDLTGDQEYNSLNRQFDTEMQVFSGEYTRTNDYIPPVNIADDVDDEQLFGPRRRRQKKARTNTR